MRPNKDFDCVKMKNEIQARLRKRRAGLSPEEVAADVRERLSGSDAPAARLWRRLNRQAGGAGTPEHAGK